MRPIVTPTTQDQDLQETVNQFSMVPINPNDETGRSATLEGSTFGRAFDRGTDQLQATLYGFAKAVGDTFGVDAVSKWSQEGIEYNIQEILKNPPEVRDWDDVNSLAEFGTYFIEALGEQAPQLLADVPLVAASLAAAGPGGATASLAARASIGKALKRKLGERAFINFKNVVKAAPVASLVAQGVGETKMEMDAAGGDSDTLVWGTGIAKAMLDKVGLETIIGRATKLGKAPTDLLSVASEVSKAVGIGVVSEGSTEALQTILDKTAVGIETGQDIFSEDNLKEIREAVIKGALVGGTMSGGMQSAVAYTQYAQDKKTKQLDELESLLATERLNMFDTDEIVGEGFTMYDAAPDPLDLAEAPTIHGSQGDNDKEEEETLALPYSPEITQTTKILSDHTGIDPVEMAEHNQRQKQAMEEARPAPGPSVDPNVKPVERTPEQRTAFGSRLLSFAQEHNLEPGRLGEKVQQVFAGLTPETQSRVKGLLEGGETPQQLQVVDMLLAQAKPLYGKAAPEPKTKKTGKLSDTADVRHLEEVGSPSQNLVDGQSLQEDYLQAVTSKSGEQLDQDTQDEIESDPSQNFLDSLGKDSANALAPETLIPADMANRSRHTPYREVPYQDGEGKVPSFLNQQNAEKEVDRLNSEAGFDGDRNAKNAPYFIKPTWRTVGKRRSKVLHVMQRIGGPETQDRTSDEYFANAKAAARRSGEMKYGMSTAKNRGERVRQDYHNSQITLFDPETGEEAHFSTMDLATAGMNMLTVEQTNGMEAEQFRLAGFLTALGRLIEEGYVATNYKDTEGRRTLSPLKNKRVRTAARSDVESKTASSPMAQFAEFMNPNLILDHGKLDDGDVKTRVSDVLFSPEQTRKTRAAIAKAKRDNNHKEARRLEQTLATNVKLADSLNKLTELEQQAADAFRAQDHETGKAKNAEKKRLQSQNKETALFQTDDYDPAAVNPDAPAKVSQVEVKVDDHPNAPSEKRTRVEYSDQGTAGTNIDNPASAPREIEGGDVDNSGTYRDDRLEDKVALFSGQFQYPKDHDPDPIDKLQDNLRVVERQIALEAERTFDETTRAAQNIRAAEAHNRVFEELDSIERQIKEAQEEIRKENEKADRQNHPVKGKAHGKQAERVPSRVTKAQKKGKLSPAQLLRVRVQGLQAEARRLRKRIGDSKPIPMQPLWGVQAQVTKRLRDLMTLRNKLRQRIQAKGKPQDKPKAQPRIRGFNGAFGELTLRFVQETMQELGLNLRLTLVDPQDIDALVDAGVMPIKDAMELKQEFHDGRLTNSGPKAAFISHGKEGFVVIPKLRQNASDANRAQFLWRVAHELGHGVLNAAMDNMTPAQWQMAEKMFQQDKANSPAYQGINGFAEWFADQVANRAIQKEAKHKPKGERNAPLMRTFDKVLAKLKQIYQAFDEKISKRFNPHKDFNAFVQDMKDSGVFKKATSFGFGPREYYIDMAQGARDWAALKERIKTWVKNIYEKPFVRHPINAVITSDNQLRYAYGEVGEEIANMFYWQFNTKKPTIYDDETGRHVERRPWFSVVREATERYMGDFFNTMGVVQGQSERYSDAELHEAFMQLAKELPDEQLNAAATQLRKWIKNYHTKFLKNSIPTVGETENYFPRQYVQSEIETRRIEFNTLLRRHGVEDPDAVFANLFEDQVGIDAFTASMAPSGKHTKGRTINDPQLIEALVEAGFINSNPVETMVAYLFSTIQEGTYHYEFGGYRYLPGARKNTTIDRMRSKGRNAEADAAEQVRDQRLQEFLELNNLASLDEAIEKHYVRMSGPDIQVYDKSMKINVKLDKGVDQQKITPAQANRIRKLISAMQGKVGLDMDPRWKHVQSNAMMITNWMTLFLSPVSSLIEFAMLTKSVKDVGNYRMAVKGIIASVRNRDELLHLYGQMGMVEHTLQAHIISAMFGYQNSTTFAQKGNELLFKMNGQSWLTTTMRIAAAETAKQFIKHHAPRAVAGDTRSKRYLAELGITQPEFVQQWVDEGEPLWDMDANNRVARVMQSGISRFIESSVLTPNRAERPEIMQDPRWGLFWHLKSFAYTFAHNVTGTVVQEWKSRNKEGLAQGKNTKERLVGNAAFLLPMVGVFMGLAMIVNELREELQYALGGDYRPSDNMDTGQYVKHLLFNRIGFGAVGDMYFNALTNQYNNTLGVFALSPVLGKADQLLNARNNLELVMNATPVLAQNPGAKRALREIDREFSKDDE